MVWAKIDCGLFRDLRVHALKPPEQLAFIRLILWSQEAETDGHIPSGALGVAGVSTKHVPPIAAVGLMEPNGDGWNIVNFLKHQESSERRAVKRAAARKGAEARWGKKPP